MHPICMYLAYRNSYCRKPHRQQALQAPVAFLIQQKTTKAKKVRYRSQYSFCTDPVFAFHALSGLCAHRIARHTLRCRTQISFQTSCSPLRLTYFLSDSALYPDPEGHIFKQAMNAHQSIVCALESSIIHVNALRSRFMIYCISA